MVLRSFLILFALLAPTALFALPNPYLPPAPEDPNEDCPGVRAGDPCPDGVATPPTFESGPVNVTSLAINASDTQTVTVGSDSVSTVYMTAQSSSQTAIPDGNIVINGAGPDSCTIVAGTCDMTIQVTPAALPASNPVTITVYICETAPVFTCLNSGSFALSFFTVQVISGANPCTFTPNPPSAMVAAASTSSQFTLTVAGDPPCSWSASANQSWVTNISPPSGSTIGDTLVTLTLDQNATSQSRQSTVTIDPAGAGLPNSTFIVTQAGLPCTYSLSINGGPPDMGNPVQFDQSGGVGSITINTLVGCPWQVDRNPAWISLNPTSGSGPGSTDYTVAVNGTGSPRSTLDVGDELDISSQPVYINQSALVCNYAFDISNSNFGSGAGSDLFDVTVNSGCLWTITDDQNWISVDTTAGDGNLANISLDVLASTSGITRNGTVSLRDAANQVVDTIAVSQTGLGCAFTVSPPSSGFDTTGGAGGFSFNLNDDCTWSASESATWISGLTPAGGTSTGIGATINVNFNVAANATTSPRNHDIQVASVGSNGMHSVTQAGDCDINLDSLALNFDENGGTQMIALTDPTSCDWTTSDNQSWITVTPPSGNTDATINVTVDVNPTNDPRAGSAFIGDETVAITQDPQPICDPSIDVSQITPDHIGTMGTVNLTLADGCPWQATSNVPWITDVLPAGGTSDGSNIAISYTVLANTGVSQRTGTVDIAGQVFTVIQSADVSVIINEVQQAPFDRFELINVRGSMINLGGLSFVTTGNIGGSFSVGAVDLAAGALIEIPVNLEVWTPGSAGSLAIVDAEGVGIDFVRWANANNPPPGGTAFSAGSAVAPYTDSHVIGRDAASTDTDSPADWCIQQPSLSLVNSICIANLVLVNEFDTGLPDYIELFNLTTVPVDISNWMVDSTGSIPNFHTLPVSPVIPGGGYVRVEELAGVVVAPETCDYPLNPVSNCGFETGDFSSWVVNDIFDTYDADPANPISIGGHATVTGPGMVSTDNYEFFLSEPSEGVFAAAHGFDGTSGMVDVAGVIEISQDVSLTPETRRMFFDYRAAWDLFTFCVACLEDRVFQVEIQPSGGGAPMAIFEFLRLEPQTQIFDTGSLLGNVSLQAFAGQDVRIAFVWIVPEPFTGPAFFQLDNVRVAGIPPGTILTGTNFSWFNSFRGSVLLSTDLGDPVDFVRWGGSSTLPPGGTGWSGDAPVPILNSDVSGRTAFSSDTDQGSDWCLQEDSSAARNPLCNGEILHSDGFENPMP